MKSQDYESEFLDQNGFDHYTEKGTKRSSGRGTKVDPNPNNPHDTPRGYMKMIKEKTGDFTTFFTILCRQVENEIYSATSVGIGLTTLTIGLVKL